MQQIISNPLQEVISKAFMEMLFKAGDTSVLGTLWRRESLDEMLYLNGAPPAPFLQRLSIEPATGDPHYWSKVSLGTIDGTSGYFVEGTAPTGEYKTPTRAHNHLFQNGVCAEITDKQAMLFARSGGFTLRDGSGSQKFTEEMNLQMEINLRTLIQRLDYIFIQGNNDVTIDGGEQDVQCDGLLEWLVTNATDASSAVISDTLLINLGKDIHDQYGGQFPDTLYVNSNQKKEINTWATNVWFTRNRNLEAGKDVSTFNTGYFILSLVVEPYMPAASCAMVDHNMFSRCDLEGITAQPLAKTNTSQIRMITYYGTLKCGNDLTSGKLYGLSY